jgi:IclR family KDG regulon transcriptional repressor
MSTALGTAKSTISRIAHTLETEGYLSRLPGRDGYRLGLRLWELGSVAIFDRAEFSQRALPHLEALMHQLGQSVHAGILDNRDVVYVQKVDAVQSLIAFIPLGARFPAHCTATGKCLLAHRSDQQIKRILSSGIKAYTARTVTNVDALVEELRAVRRRGYAINKGEWREDIGGIAAPVRDRTGAVIGAVGVSMPLLRFPKDPHSTVAQAIVSAASHVSRDLGFLPPAPQQPSTEPPPRPLRPSIPTMERPFATTRASAHRRRQPVNPTRKEIRR